MECFEMIKKGIKKGMVAVIPSTVNVNTLEKVFVYESY
jgi:hypothetical protein